MEKSEIDLLKEELSASHKEIKEIKAYINKMRHDALKSHGENFGVLMFIQRLEEAFTWVRKTK